MNTNTLQKHYGKLTPRERLAALLESGLRGDDGESLALVQSAPKVNYTVTHHYFLGQAWDKMAAVQTATLLSMGCAFYQGQGILHMMDASDNPDESRMEGIFAQLVELARAFRVLEAGWAAFCAGQGMDPLNALACFPGSGIYPPDAPPELLARRDLDTLPLLRRAVARLAPEEPDPGEVAALAQGLKESLDLLAGQQSGGWG